MVEAAPRILLVDDISESRAALIKEMSASHLDLAGEAELGTGAVAAAREQQPDVVVLSFEEPVARAVRTIESLVLAVPETPVIVVSSLGSREHLRRAMLAGARDYLVKPVSADDLARAVDAVLEVRQKKRSVAHQPEMEIPHHAEVVTVFGAKGGVGRTTLATNLAVALATVGNQKVALVDLDTQLGDVAMMLDLVPERTIADLARAAGRMDPELVRAHMAVHASGVHVLAAPVNLEDAAVVSGDHVSCILQVLARAYDFVIVDTPKTISDPVSVALELSTIIVVVTSPEITSVKSTRVYLDMFRSLRFTEDKVKLLINYPSASGGLSARDLQAVLDYPVFWRIPNDAAAIAACRAGRPFVLEKPASKISRNLVDLSYAITGSRMPRSDGFLGRLIGSRR